MSKYDHDDIARWYRMVESATTRLDVHINREWFSPYLIRPTLLSKFEVIERQTGTLKAYCQTIESAEAACRLLTSTKTSQRS